MIDPRNIINHNRTEAELEELALFLVMVAGKQAKTTAIKLDKFLGKNAHQPFLYIRSLVDNFLLTTRLKEIRAGQYNRIALAFQDLALSRKDLKTITVEELEQMHGIGPKSARCFLSWTRPDVQYAMLDTHILKYLRDILKVPNVPKSTPSGKKYLELEKVFLDHAKLLNRNPAELDLEIWKSYQHV